MKVSIPSLIAGVVIGLVIAGLAERALASSESRRLTAPATICLARMDGCTPVGELSEGVVLAVDPKGFAQVFLRVEPGLRPNGNEAAPGEQATLLRLETKP